MLVWGKGMAYLIFGAQEIPAELKVAVAKATGAEILGTIAIFFAYFIGVAIQEELLFRVLPLGFGRFITKDPRVLLWMIVIPTSILFGFVHGSVWNILIQGVGGMILCIVYLMCGGYQGKILKPFFMTSAIHCVYDTIIVTGVLLSALP